MTSLDRPDNSAAAIRLIPYHQSLLTALAEHILARASDPADLTDVVVLLPQSLTAPEVRQALLHVSGQQAQLGPHITTFNQWVMAQPHAQPILSDQTAELTLVEALQAHLHLFGDDSPWRVAEALRQLFQELTLQHIPLPYSLDDWTARLEQAYGTQTRALQREALIVFQLWQAWQQQLAASGCLDQAGAYLQRLATMDTAGQQLYLLGAQAFTRPERDWLQQQLAQGRLTWLLQAPVESGLAEQALQPLLALGATHADNEHSAVDEIFTATFPTSDSHLQERAARLRNRFSDSPLHDHLQCFTADNPEQEARGIDLQVRRWLLDGKRRIGIVTEDRRLARRVRALLERAGIELQDSGGWALSTTTAASALERWLECIEEDFAHLPLLDLLKSPWLFPQADREQHLKAVYRLEQDVILHEQITRNLTRYQQHLDYRQHRLEADANPVYDQLRTLLQLLGEAAANLRALLVGSHSAQDYLAALHHSLQALGIWDSWQEDAAGLRLVSLFDSLHAAAEQQPLTLDWSGFRAWLGGNIERTTFRPAQSGGPVQLLTLEQSQGLQFDALILGGCDAEHLPGKASVSPFFNDAVRQELGLATWQQQYQWQLYHFRRVLEAAPHRLLTWHQEDQGDPVLPSPWLDALLTLHQLAFGTRLEALDLAQGLQQPHEVAPALQAPLPTVPTQPRPVLPAVLTPTSVSPSSHQQLINCPYQYFAAQGLRLQAPEPLREALAKSDYGGRVHLCLEAFHSNIADLPGPFKTPLTQHNREAAIDLLIQIAEAVFARDLEDNFQHRGWLKRWLRRIPQYVDWQIARQAEWRVQATEEWREQPLADNLLLKGRLDRIDKGSDGIAILDYKTGAAASEDEVLAGEAVQLPCYVLLSEQRVSEVGYVKLDDDPVRSGAQLGGEQLDELSSATLTRLLETHNAILNQAPLPAWGDATTCSYCDMRGLCRKEIWDA